MTCGFLILDKPTGMTSRRAVDRVKRLVKPHKTGHTGTLDPLASGVLVVAVGKATSLVARVHAQHKTYRATFLLGRRSESDDTELEVEVLEETPELDRATIESALEAFVGPISQVPPLQTISRSSAGDCQSSSRIESIATVRGCNSTSSPARASR